jgi:membrane-bound lytic murein transglycosylase D
MCLGKRFLILLVSLYGGMVFATSVAATYPSASYVLAEFDLDEGYLYNREFEQFVQKHAHALGRFYRKSIAHSAGLLSLLQGKLIDDDLSDLFLYMSIVESGLHTRARSSKKAAGLWQFMPATAKSYRLRVGSTCDERCDPERATEAAIAHLRHLYTRFGKWYLVVLAYNCGEGCLSRAIQKAGTDDVEILLDAHSKYLPKETRDYLKKILLVAMIGESDTIEESTASEPVKVEVRPGTDLRVLARLLRMDAASLLKLNPALKNGIVPKDADTYQIEIPEEKIARFYLRYDTMPKVDEPKPFFISHQVVLGDTLAYIAHTYGSTAAEIRAANHLKNDVLEVGAILIVPVTQKRFDALLRKKR